MKEFFELVKPYIKQREVFLQELSRCQSAISLSEAEFGTTRVRQAAISAGRMVHTRIKLKNIWGIRVAEPQKINFVRKPLQRGYDMASTPCQIDDAALSFEKLMSSILDLAANYVKIKKMGHEIKKTTRRVNALEQTVIPTLTAEVRFIRSTLEEREREDVFRMKLIKKATGPETILEEDIHNE
jgi:V/A-type H+-transporting ATPase subunit D